MSALKYAFVVLGLAVSLVGSCSMGCKCAVGDASDPCDSYRRYPCSTSPSSLCDADGNPAEPLTMAEAEYVAAHCQGGD